MKAHEYIAMEVARERERQVEKEGYNPSHDDQHVDGSIANAAAHYAATKTPLFVQNDTANKPEYVRVWPWDEAYNKKNKPSHPRRKQLVIAAALCIAEIERLDRIAPQTHHKLYGQATPTD